MEYIEALLKKYEHSPSNSSVAVKKDEKCGEVVMDKDAANSKVKKWKNSPKKGSQRNPNRYK